MTTHLHYSWLQLGTLMLKEQGIHEGLWQVGVEAGLGATNVGPTAAVAVPGLVVTLMNVTLTSVEVMLPLTLDAAVVNPRTASN